MHDVIVVGAGPGGAAAAKRCAEHGLRTLVVEKKRLPREKVCSGLILGALAKDLIAEEFGPVPEDIVLRRMHGLRLWMPGVGERVIAHDTPITWRRDLDYWMLQAALAAGAELWEDTLVKGISSDGSRSRMTVRKSGTEREIEAGFVIGADGAYSTVRRSMFPDQEFATSAAYREWYRGSPQLEDGWVYVIFPTGQYRPNVWVCPKDDGFTLEGGGVKPVGDEVRALLRAAGWAETEPEWRDGCVSRALLFEHLASGRFVPAKGNALLVGDAAGFQFPISGEGIGTALRSGLEAADAVAKAVDAGGSVTEHYLGRVAPLIATLRECYVEVGEIRARSGEALLDGVAAGFARSLEID